MAGVTGKTSAVGMKLNVSDIRNIAAQKIKNFKFAYIFHSVNCY